LRARPPPLHRAELHHRRPVRGARRPRGGRGGTQPADQARLAGRQHRDPVTGAHRRRSVSRWIDMSTPAAARQATTDDPPYETNGSGTPTMGARPITMPTLMNV